MLIPRQAADMIVRERAAACGRKCFLLVKLPAPAYHTSPLTLFLFRGCRIPQANATCESHGGPAGSSGTSLREHQARCTFPIVQSRGCCEAPAAYCLCESPCTRDYAAVLDTCERPDRLRLSGLVSLLTSQLTHLSCSSTRPSHQDSPDPSILHVSVVATHKPLP